MMKIIIDERPHDVTACSFSQINEEGRYECLLDNYNFCKNICNEEPSKCKAIVTIDEMNR